MKRILMVVFLLPLLVDAQANAATTKGGHAACLTKQWYEDMIQFVAQGDRASFNAYIEARRCVVVKAGLRVSVVEWPGMFGGTAAFVYQGVKLWTAREALDYLDAGNNEERKPSKVPVNEDVDRKHQDFLCNWNKGYAEQYQERLVMGCKNPETCKRYVEKKRKYDAEVAKYCGQ